MGITSLWFIGFVFATLIVFWLFPIKMQWWILLIASVVFYLTFSVGGIFVMIITALLTFFAGLWVQRFKDELGVWLKENKKTKDKETIKAVKVSYRKKQKLIVAGTIVLIVSILFFSKYYNVLSTNVNLIFHTQLWTAENILLPLGISYYSLQLIGYLVDVNRDIISAERNPLKVILYGGFFLSIMQGPFNRYNDLMPQLCAEERKKLTYFELKNAILRIVAGYIKKLCFADQVGVVANEVFTHYDNYNGLGIILGIICFAVQLYADFSGYMDIIIGIGQLFRINMPENFRQPFFSRTISEFWKRWHITLGLWLQDYVFYPMLKSNAFRNMGKSITVKIGKEAGRRIPTYLGMLILWILIGTWHGAGINYVFGVGVLQFLYIFLGELCDPIFKRIKKFFHINDQKFYWHIFQSIRTTALMLIAWVFFNSQSFDQALSILSKVFVLPSFRQIADVFYNDYITGEPVNWLVYIVLVVIILFVIDIFHEHKKSIRAILLLKPFPIRLAFYLSMVFAILVFGAYGNQYSSNQFIYFEF